jgi:hypothetical protein
MKVDDPEIAVTREWAEPIKLRWGQAIAAFFSIYWPVWIVGFVFLGFLDLTTIEDMARNGSLFLLAGLINVIVQGVLTFRLTRKNYRTFWIGVVHENEPPRRQLTFVEQFRVAWQILMAQIVFVAATDVLFAFFGQGSAEAVRFRTSLQAYLTIFVVGPLSIRWALAVSYRGFRLQAYRLHRKVSSWSSLRNLPD